MAIGVGKMFGIEIPENFNSPYRAVSVKDFWKRWHMTLSRFLQTYVYFPLGGSRKGKLRTFVNTMITFLVSGLWHGANWTFVFWGFLHGLGVAAAGMAGNKKEGKSPQGKGTQNRALRPFVPACHFFLCLHGIRFLPCGQHSGWISAFVTDLFLPCGREAFADGSGHGTSENLYRDQGVIPDRPFAGGSGSDRCHDVPLAVSFFVLSRKNTVQIIERKQISFGFTLWLAFLFAWSVISLSGCEHLCLF